MSMMNTKTGEENAAENKPHDGGSALYGTVLTDDIDDLVLQANGHAQAMRRQFSWLSALGLGFSITNSWAGYLSNFGHNMAYGGPRLVIFGLIIAWMVQSLITIGLAEIGSAFPSSGGQYHFCFLLSPSKTKRFSEYIIGWMSVVAWWMTTCSGISLCATTLAGLINFSDPSFIATQWQVYLLYVAAAIITILPVFNSSKSLAFMCHICLLISIVGVSLYGSSGWGSGPAWMLAICNGMYAFGGTDAALHISEEMQHPGRRVPQIIIAIMIIGLVTTLPLFTALLLFSSDTKAMINSPLPSVELVYQVCGSRVGTIFLISWLLVVYMSCLPSQWVTSGRLAWAFARDYGVPFSPHFTAISPKYQFPVRTTTAAFTFVLAYGLLYLASTTAFNSIITSAVLFLNITYAVPQGILLFRGRHNLPRRWLNLGWFGYFCNLFSLLWVIILGVFVCFPPKLPVSVGSMNYIAVIVVGTFGVITGFWFGSGRGRFRGPSIDWGLLKRVNETGSRLK
ncbi:amino acid/polyamine transporter I [Aspergillus egyptiacus]|nr:amino acid/polyamine transporter I [Aspergillus egyptiacus]